jgi:PhzF family phenazine biosynthesis protein
MTIPLYQVDAFTDQPYKGNPAAVCILPDWRPESWLQAVAAEMNLSETAFLVKRPNHFDLRWFTPKAEVALCGHATLAPSHVLWEEKVVKPGDEIRYSTKSGILKAIQSDGLIELDFPLKPEEPADAPPGFIDALGVKPTYLGKNQFDYLVEVAGEAELLRLAPDFRKLASIPVRGTIVTSRSSNPKFDFVSRFFAPAVGVDEDPVTGSAHCCLGYYWQKRLGKNLFLAYQASPRGGVVRVRVQGERAFLGGTAVTVSRGQLLV